MMTKHPLQTLLEDTDAAVRSYSGRGMYGRKCVGVELDSDSDMGALVADLMFAAKDLNATEMDIVTGVIRRGLSTDSMGLGTIVYFPNVPFAGKDPDDEDDSDV